MQNHTVSVQCQAIWSQFAGHFKNEATAEAYLAEIAEFELISGIPFFQMCPGDAEYYFEHLKGKESSGTIHMSTLTKKLWELHSFASFAVERRGEFSVPEEFEDYFMDWLKHVKPQAKFVHSVPVADMDKLYKAAQEDCMAYTIIALLHRAGLSSTEIISLKKEDFSVYDNGTFAFITHRQDVCYIPEDVSIILDQYLRQAETAEYLFYNRSGKQLNKMYVSRMLKKYTQKAQIPSYSAQRIRTTCGITMSAYGAGPGQIAKQMGITKTQIQKYQNRQYRDNLQVKANELVKIRIEPPNES